MTREDGVLILAAKDRMAWRQWLIENHAVIDKVWLLMYRKESGIPSVYYPDAVEEALCFGWIDSKPNKNDEQSYYQFFAKRNPKSNWSNVNKMKADELIAKGLMTEEGYKAIDLAKKNGTWNALDEVELLMVPNDLQSALDALPNAATNFNAFPKSVKRGILEWILNAKKEETRQKRIEETAILAQENKRANQFTNKKQGN
jgi:uncharacterized protein YdeI (YjbR/CyaY-like superfamily)